LNRFLQYQRDTCVTISAAGPTTHNDELVQRAFILLRQFSICFSIQFLSISVRIHLFNLIQTSNSNHSSLTLFYLATCNYPRVDLLTRKCTDEVGRPMSSAFVKVGHVDGVGSHRNNCLHVVCSILRVINMSYLLHCNVGLL